MIKHLLILLYLFNGILYAQNLSMQECIDKAILNHPNIKSTKLQVKQSKHKYESARSDYLPQVNLQASYNPTQTFALPVNGAFQTVDEYAWSAGVELKQKIWDFEKTSSNIEATKFEETISKLSLKDTQALIIYQVKSFYLEMILQEKAIKVRKKDLEAKKAYYEQAKALVEQGLKTNADASRFLSSVYEAKDNLAIAYSLYSKAKISLSLYINDNIDDDVELESDLIEKNYTFNSDIVSQILQKNYQLKIEKKNIDKNNLLHKSAKAAHYGSIDGYASYNRINTLNEYDSTLVGVSLNIPLYTGGRTTSQEQTAQINTQIAREAQASKILSLKEDLESLLIDIKRYDNTILAKKAQIDAANDARNVLEGRYEEGLTTYIEVLDTVSIVLNAQLELLQTYYSKSMAINQIQYLEGNI